MDNSQRVWDIAWRLTERPHSMTTMTIARAIVVRMAEGWNPDLLYVNMGTEDQTRGGWPEIPGVYTTSERLREVQVLKADPLLLVVASDWVLARVREVFQ